MDRWVLSVFALLGGRLLLIFRPKNIKANRRYFKMNISRKLGVLVFFAVPAIVGGGIVYAVFGGYHAVAIYEILLLGIASGFFSK